MSGEERAAELVELQQARQQMKQIEKNRKRLQAMREKVAGACG